MNHRQKSVMALIGVCLALGAGGTGPRPLTGAHAHNDYEHARPLVDALECGFCSVEADVYPVDGKLLVAHERKKVTAERTLEALYLAPLRRRVEENGGRVYRDGPPVTLLIDFKEDPPRTYELLRDLLKPYAPMLTVHRDGKAQPGAVTVILTGDWPRDMVAAERERYVAGDGRPEDLDKNPPADLLPWISCSWGTLFKWRGTGAMPETEKQALRKLAERVHGQGRKLRFWGTPDKPAFWTQLRAAGVDLISADDLEGLQKFLAQGRTDP